MKEGAERSGLEPGDRALMIQPGEHRATRQPMVYSTILGSCVAACLFDEQARVAGMNHFLLANRRYSKTMPLATTDAGRYGIHAMELLINDMVKLGAERKRLKAKIFGGGRIIEEMRDSSFICVGDVNRRFIKEYLEIEGIPAVSEDLGGERGRYVRFRTDTFQAFRRFIPKIETLKVERRELEEWEHEIEDHDKAAGDVILFR